MRPSAKCKARFTLRGKLPRKPQQSQPLRKRHRNCEETSSFWRRCHMIAWTKILPYAVAVASISALVVTATPAEAGPVSSLTASFYTLAPNHPDVEHGIDGLAVTGLVNSTLSAGGLPTVSAMGAAFGGASGPITDVNG